VPAAVVLEVWKKSGVGSATFFIGDLEKSLKVYYPFRGSLIGDLFD
jgi:hypothetical protein